MTTNDHMVDVFANIHTSCANCEDCPCEKECEADPRAYSARLCKEAITEYVKTVAMGLLAAKPTEE